LTEILFQSYISSEILFPSISIIRSDEHFQWIQKMSLSLTHETFFSLINPPCCIASSALRWKKKVKQTFPRNSLEHLSIKNRQQIPICQQKSATKAKNTLAFQNPPIPVSHRFAG
jgi:hypothetical protein